MVDTATKLRRAFIGTPKIFYAVLLVILCILFADLKGRPRTFNSPETRILERIFRNVNQKPITEITTVTTGGSCTAGLSSVALGSWPGTVIGCLCGTTLTPGSCTKSGCTTIQGVSAQHITQWKGARFCASRNSDFSFPNQTGETQCSGSTPQLCALSGVCIPQGETCPLTSLQLTFDTTTGSLTGVTGSNTLESPPITDLIVSLFDFPCMDPDAMPNTKTKRSYPLSVIPENGCQGTGLIDHLQNIDNQDLTALLNENNFAAISNLPGYSDFITSEKAYLVALRQYQLETAVARCGSVDPVRFTEVQEDENFYIKRVYPLVIASIVVMSIKFFTILIELILRIRKNEEEDHWLDLFAGGNLLLLLGACVLFIIIGGFGAHAVIRLSPNTSYFKFLAYNQCFEQTVVNRIFQVFQGNISNFWAIVWLSITLLIIACSAIIVVIILGIINYCYGRRGEFSSYYKNVGKKLGKSSRKKNQAPVNKSTANIEMLLAR